MAILEQSDEAVGECRFLGVVKASGEVGKRRHRRDPRIDTIGAEGGGEGGKRRRDERLVFGVDSGPGPRGDSGEEWIAIGGGLFERGVGRSNPHPSEGVGRRRLHGCVWGVESGGKLISGFGSGLSDCSQGEHRLHPFFRLASEGSGG